MRQYFKHSKAARWAGLVSVVILGACSPVPQIAQPNQSSSLQTQAVEKYTSLAVKLTFIARASSSDPASRSYAASDVRHLVIKLFYLKDGAELPALDQHGVAVSVDVSPLDFDKTVTLPNVLLGRTYRVRFFAYKADGVNDSDLISRADGHADIQVLDASQLPDVILSVELTDDLKTGATPSPSPTDIQRTGDALSPGVTIVDGGYVQYDVATLAGGQSSGYVDGDLSVAEFQNPSDVAVDAQGDILVADTWNHCIRKITPTGVVSTVAGTSIPGFADGAGAEARFQNPSAIAVDAQGTIYVADSGNHCIRKVTPEGVVSTLAGDGLPGYVNGSGRSARFNDPEDIVVDGNGDVYVADSANHCIRKVSSSGEVGTFAGDGLSGMVDGQASTARFNFPMGLSLGLDGTLYVADSGNDRIRRVLRSGAVETVRFGGVGSFSSDSGLNLPTGIAVDSSGVLHIADSFNNLIRRVSDNGALITLAGDTEEGFADGLGSNAMFSFPRGLAFAVGGDMIIADYYNSAIRCLRKRHISGSP